MRASGLVERLTAMAERRLPYLTPQQLTATLDALARLEFHAPTKFLQVSHKHGLAAFDCLLFSDLRVLSHSSQPMLDVLARLELHAPQKVCNARCGRAIHHLCSSCGPNAPACLHCKACNAAFTMFFGDLSMHAHCTLAVVPRHDGTMIWLRLLLSNISAAGIARSWLAEAVLFALLQAASKQAQAQLESFPPAQLPLLLCALAALGQEPGVALINAVGEALAHQDLQVLLLLQTWDCARRCDFAHRTCLCKQTLDPCMFSLAALLPTSALRLPSSAALFQSVP